MKKRLLSVCLSLCMALLLLPASAFASSDIAPPVVTGIYMDNPGQTVSPGDTLEFRIAVEDESEIIDAFLRFEMKGSTDRENPIHAWFDSYDDKSKTALLSLEITDNIPCATWELKFVNIEDYYGNSYFDFIEEKYNGIKFVVENSGTDISAPKVLSIECESEKVNVSAGDTLNYKIVVEDESEIINSSLRFSMKGSDDNSNHVYARLSSYDASSKTILLSLEITDSIPCATWTLDWMDVRDYYGNYYSENIDDEKYESIYFVVEDSGTDITPPKVLSIESESKNKVAFIGDILNFRIAIEDESEIHGALLRFKIKDTNYDEHAIYAWFDSYDSESKTITVGLEITDDIPCTTWVLSFVNVTDYYRNTYAEIVEDNKYGDISFTVADQNRLPQSVSIPETMTISVGAEQLIQPSVEPVTAIPKWTWTSADSSIAEVSAPENGKSCLVSGISVGETTITGTTQNGLTATCTVSVIDAPLPEGGTVEESYHVALNDYIDIVPVLTPPNATTKYEVVSDNSHVAEVVSEPGDKAIRIYGNNSGTSDITIRGANGLVMTTTVKVGNDSDEQHEKSVLAGYAPTCTNAGRTDAIKCSACGYFSEKAKRIPETGHKLGEWKVVKEATAKTEGLKERVCENEDCDYKETEKIPATGGSSSGGGSGGSSSGGSGGGEGSSSTSTNTTTNSDGSKTTTTTDKATGTVTTTTKYTDGTIVKVVEAADGSSTTERTHSDGTKATTTQDKDGVVKSEVTLSIKAVETAEKAETPIKLPIAQQKPQRESKKAPTVTVNVPGSKEAKIEIPVKNISGGTVAVAVGDNGEETVLKTAMPTTEGIVINASGKVTVKIVDNSKEFSDVPTGRWITDAVDFVSARGMFSGTSEGCFSPNGSMTRGMLATVLHNLEGNPAATVAAKFTDLRDGAWYSAGVCWAAEKGILSGYGDGRVGPDKSITREQLAVILWKYAGSPAVSGNELRFTDAASASNYAKIALQWATENGIMAGSSSGALNPKAPATRAEVAQMLKNYLEQNYK